MPNIPWTTRLKPVIPTLIWWSILTSLAVHRLNIRHRSEAEISRINAQISVLETLVKQCLNGERLTDDAVRKELEMVGLRERTALTSVEGGELSDAADVGWREALFGRKLKRDKAKGSDKEEEEKAVQEWVDGRS
jgi:hypothetical protein